MQEGQAHSNIDFKLYLDRYRLDPMEVAKQAGVRYVTVWNIAINRPVTLAHANQVRAALVKMTGVPYDGHLAVIAS